MLEVGVSEVKLGFAFRADAHIAQHFKFGRLEAHDQQFSIAGIADQHVAFTELEPIGLGDLEVFAAFGAGDDQRVHATTAIMFCNVTSVICAMNSLKSFISPSLASSSAA